MIEASYTALYRQEAAAIGEGMPEWLTEARGRSLLELENGKLAVCRDRYAIDYGINLRRVPLQGDPASLFSCDIPGLDAVNFLVVNEALYAVSGQEYLPEGVIACSTREALRKHADLVRQYWGALASRDGGADWAFNQLFASDGLFLYVPDGARIERPVQLVNLMYGDSDTLAATHNLVILGEGASARVLVCDHANGKGRFLANRVTEVYVGENSTYEHYKVASTSDSTVNLSRLCVRQQAGSEVLSNLLSLSGELTRNDVYVWLDGQRARLSLNGMGLGSGSGEVANHTRVWHLTPGATTDELFKYILDDESKGEFFGLINVRPGADGTVANQTNRNLCLTPGARMRTLPQLEIYADDVRCNHGAAIGQLDEQALFYMRQRGIGREQALELLKNAFVSDVLDNVRIPELKDRLRRLVSRHLRGEDSACQTCNACRRP